MTRSVYSPAYRRLCEWLVSARLTQRLTQLEVARRLGKPQSFVSKYERGERRLDVVEVVEIAAALSADPCELLSELAQMAGPSSEREPVRDS